MVYTQYFIKIVHFLIKIYMTLVIG